MASENLLKCAGNIWKLLDDMQETNPEEYEKFIQKTLQEGKSEFAPPKFHFSIKCRDTKSQQYCYINVCSYAKIPPPRSDDEPINVYAGNRINDVVDEEDSFIEFFAVSPEVLKEIDSDFSLKEMLIELAVKYYNDCRDYVLLQCSDVSRAMVGSPSNLTLSFFKRNTSNRLNYESTEKSDIKLPFNVGNDVCEPAIDIFRDADCSGRKANLIQELKSSANKLEFHHDVVDGCEKSLKISTMIHSADSIKDIDLEVINGHLKILLESCPELNALYEIPYFAQLDEDSVSAKFTKTKKLIIKFNFLS